MTLTYSSVALSFLRAARARKETIYIGYHTPTGGVMRVIHPDSAWRYSTRAEILRRREAYDRDSFEARKKPKEDMGTILASLRASIDGC